VAILAWPLEIKRRVIRIWYLKAIANAVFLYVFFHLYFALLEFPRSAVIAMPTTWLDDSIAFWPSAFYMYASLWVYTALVPALQPSFKALLCYGSAIGAVCLTGLVFFYFLPTKVPFKAVELSTDSSLDILRKIDMAGNACPSLHVATAILTAMCLRQILLQVRAPGWLRLSNWLWCIVIVYSTMAIKQHVVWDVVAGLMLGGIFGLIYPHYERLWLVGKTNS
jgi:membrane-associated phospholipid phosphatase